MFETEQTQRILLYGRNNITGPLCCHAAREQKHLGIAATIRSLNTVSKLLAMTKEVA